MDASDLYEIDLDRLWRVAVKAITEDGTAGLLTGQALLAEAKLSGSPLSIGNLITEGFDVDAAIAKIRGPASP